MLRHHLVAMSIGVAFACGAAANAQQTDAPQQASTADQNSDQLQEIIVTAERRAEDVQKTAASVDVRSGDQLTNEGKYTLRQQLEDVAGVTVGTAAPGDAPGINIVIRGAIPGGNEPGSPVVPTTAVYTDGVYSGLGSGYDIDRVEVLRGPQGTLYGRSATGGVVAFHTHDPELGNFSLDGTAEYGSYDLEHATAAVNAPIGDQVAIRVAGNYYSRDGFFSSEGGYTRSTAGKLKLLYKPNDDFSLLVGSTIENNYPNTGGGSFFMTTPNAYHFVPAPLGRGAYNISHQTWAEMNWNLNFATLTYLPAYRTFFTNSLSVGPGPGSIQISVVNQEPADRFFTNELRLASPSGSKLIWQVGGLYYDASFHNLLQGTVVSDGNIFLGSNVTKTTTDLGAFGEATLPFGGGWRATAGVRYDHTGIETGETYTAGTNAFGFIPGVPNINSTVTLLPGQGNSAFNNVTFKARLETDLTASNMLYAMISTGFLPGDVQVGTNVVLGVTEATATRFDQEKLTAYELGSKNRFLDNRLQLNADVFYYNYNQYQAYQDVSPVTPGAQTETTPARMYGIELDGLYQLSAHDRVGVTYAYIDPTFFDVPHCPGSTTMVCFGDIFSNTKIPGIAPTTIYSNYDHDLHLPNGSSMNFRGSVRFSSAYQSAYVYQVYNGTNDAAYGEVHSEWVGDLSVNWASANGKCSLTGYVRNVGDNDYKISAHLTGLGPSFRPTATLYDPRTFGVIVQIRI